MPTVSAGRGLRQERRGQPDPLVQGPGRQRGDREGARAWLRGGRLRLDRQPRQRRRGARGRGGPRVIRLRARPTWRSRRSSRPASTAPSLVAVRGNYDDVNRLCTELSGGASVGVRERQPAALLRGGLQDTGFEVAEQLGFELPDRVVCPVASGSLFTKIARGFEEWLELGLLEGVASGLPRRPGRGLQPGGAPRSRPVTRSAGRSGPRRSPSRWRSATLPTACSRSTWRAAPAARIDVRHRRGDRRRASGCWPRRPASSPRRPAASPPRCWRSSPSGATSAPTTASCSTSRATGLKTLDAVRDIVSTYEVEPTLDSFTETVPVGGAERV